MSQSCSEDVGMGMALPGGERHQGRSHQAGLHGLGPLGWCGGFQHADLPVKFMAVSEMTQQNGLPEERGDPPRGGGGIV